MAKAKKQTSRGRKHDRARVAAGQDYEVPYEAKKTVLVPKGSQKNTRHS
jgi:hypothetical protein